MRGPRALAGLGVLTLLLLLVLLPAGPASAHATLVDSDPTDGAVLAEAPTSATLGFDERVTLAPDAVRLFDDRGTEIPTTAGARDSVVTVALPAADLDEGTYFLTWRVVSADGHPVAGTLTFSVGRVSAVVTPPPAAGAAPSSVGVALSVARVLAYLGLLVSVGLAVFATLLLRGTVPVASARAHAWIRRAGTWSAALAALGALVLLPLTALDQAGLGWGGLTTMTTWTGIDQSSVASCGLLLGGLGLLAAGLQRVPPSWSLALPGALVAVVTPAFAGHTRAAEPATLVLLTDVLHVAAASVWLGGLVGLALTLPSLRGEPARAGDLIARFSAVGAVVLAALVASGALLAWRILGSWAALVDTAYGRLLLAKIVTVALAAAVAGWNRWVLLPLLRRAEGFHERRAATRWLRRTVVVEAAILVVVVGLTGVLVDRSPRGTPTSSGTASTGAETVRLSEDLQVVAVLTPGRLGRNVVRLQLQDANGEPVEPTRLPEATLATNGLELGSIPLTSDAAGTFRGEVVLPTAGEWTLQVSVRTSRFENPVGQLTFTLRP